MKSASEMTYIVSGGAGALNSTHSPLISKDVKCSMIDNVNHIERPSYALLYPINLKK